VERAIVVRGKLSDPRHIELDEPVTELRGSVEVVVRPVPPPSSMVPMTAEERNGIYENHAHDGVLARR
jgi:hypothetical protein